MNFCLLYICPKSVGLLAKLISIHVILKSTSLVQNHPLILLVKKPQFAQHLYAILRWPSLINLQIIRTETKS